MKKQKTNKIIILTIALILIFLIIQPSLRGNVIQDKQKMKLGYCPTMDDDALNLAKDNNYELVKFGSASEVLSSLNNNQIDKGLIGRKAELSEINKDVKETTLKSGYTLVTNKKIFLDYSQLLSLEIHTYLPNKETKDLISNNQSIIYYGSKQEAINKISEGKAVLISWEDWQDNFELIVVMEGSKKVKDFRGAFLYEN